MADQEKKSIWSLSPEETSSLFQTDLKKGLPSSEIEKRRQSAGFNELPKAKPISIISIFFRQFTNPLIWLLFIAAALATFLGEWVEMLTIFAIAMLNAFVGFYQELRAQKAFESLQHFLIPQSEVLRDGKVIQIPSREIVTGDLVVLDEGDQIPADGRLIYTAQFAVQEAALTGESVSVPKDTKPIPGEKLPFTDRTNFVFQGTEVATGKASFIVTGVGLNTELGKIATFLEGEKKEKTPLQIRLDRLTRRLILFCGLIVVLLFPLGLMRGESWLSMLMTTLSLALAAIPAGLAAIVTICLAVGVQNMARHNALIRRLSSVETLGCASVICADKTGTMTRNEMMVKKIWTKGVTYDVTGLGYDPNGKFSVGEKEIDPRSSEDLLQTLQIGVLCNQAEIFQSENAWRVRGDPTDGAMIVAAAKAGLDKKSLEEKNPFISELPFDSERRRMSILRKGPRLYVKGAPFEVLSVSNEASNKEIEKQVEELASAGYRVIAVAYRDQKSEELSFDQEKDLIFAGLIAMIDPPRPLVKEAIAECIKAHIHPIMMTGDHKKTAMAVASEIGLMHEGSLALEGKDLDAMDDAALQSVVMETSLFARVSEEHKLRIIRALKDNKQVVAMTGDGVNDAPAVSQADIGIAMGISGADVTKEASDMILLDDHFATIVKAITQGRTIYKNIIKFVMFLLSANLGELFALLFGILLGFEGAEGSFWVILLPAQILWINLVTDGFPAVALSFDPPDPQIMDEPPRNVAEPILSVKRSIQLLLIGFVIGVTTHVAAHFGFMESRVHGQTMAFTCLVIIELGVVSLIHSPLSWKSNPKLIGAIITSFSLQLLVLYFPPLQAAFNTTALSFSEWGILGALWCVSTSINWVILKWK